MPKPQQDPASSTEQNEQLEERSQRDQQQRSKQALSNQGSQDRQPADTRKDRERGTADDSSRVKPA